METASIRPSTATASAWDASSRKVAKEKFGIDSGGRWPGISPIRAMPWTGPSNPKLNRLPMTIASSI